MHGAQDADAQLRRRNAAWQNCDIIRIADNGLGREQRVAPDDVAWCLCFGRHEQRINLSPEASGSTHGSPATDPSVTDGGK